MWFLLIQAYTDNHKYEELWESVLDALANDEPIIRFAALAGLRVLGVDIDRTIKISKTKQKLLQLLLNLHAGEEVILVDKDSRASYVGN
jgi:hypothetical protein